MSGTPALWMSAVSKRYGRIEALRGLSFSVPQGAICGMVGPNGAGKTTAFGVALGFVRPDAGEVSVLGLGPFDPWRHKGRVGVLPQDCELSPHTPVDALLRGYARLQGRSAKEADHDVDTILDEVELNDRRGALIRQLSHGMKRRVAVAQALLGAPELILLDEPTNGLDPELMVRMRSVLRRRGGERTLVVSSHVLAELEAVCDHVLFVENGRCTRQGSLAEVTQRQRRLRYQLGGSAAALLAATAGGAGTVLSRLMEAMPGLAVEPVDQTLHLTAPVGVEAAELNARCIPVLLGAGAALEEVLAGERLESAWMARTKADEAV
jgi:ABC-type multidrug transport system ATPase subunit